MSKDELLVIRWDGVKSLNISAKKLKNLLKESILNQYLNEQGIPCISLQEAKIYIERERDINENYVTPNKFITVLKIDTRMGPFLEGVKRLGNEGKLCVEEFRGKLYIHRAEIERFKDNYISYRQVKQNWAINEYQYKEIVRLHEIEIISFTKKVLFISNSVISIIEKKLASQHIEGTASLTAIYKDPKYKNITKSPGTLKRLGELGCIDIVLTDSKIRLVKLESLEAYVNFEKEIITNYISFIEVSKILNIDTNSATKIEEILVWAGEAGVFEVRRLDKLVNNQIYYISRKSLNQFLDDFISREDAYKKYGLTGLQLAAAVRKGIVASVSFTLVRVFYNRQHIELLKEKLSINLEDYYHRSEVMTILNLPGGSLNAVLSEEKIQGVRVDSKSYFLKTQIDRLHEKQLETREKYYELDEIIELFQCTEFRPDKIDWALESRHKLTRLERTLFSSDSVNFVYEKKVADKQLPHYLDKLRKEQELSTVNYNDPVAAFFRVLEINGVWFMEDTPFTKIAWMNYCTKKLQKSEANEISIVGAVSILAKCTESLVHAIGGNELYSLTANALNLAIFKNVLPSNQQRELYTFMRIFDENLKSLGMKSYDFSKLINPYKRKPISKVKPIYVYEEYKKLYEFLSDCTIHKDRALQDAIKEIEGQACSYYASSWLYVLIHLNNAWRHADVVMLFPEIDLYTLGIKGLEWFDHYEMTPDLAAQVIAQVRSKDLKVSKTGATAHYFCSEELSVAVATAAVICQCVASKTIHQRKHPIHFGNKNLTLSKGSHSHLFKGFNTSFKFESRKMNRSLLSYLYKLLVSKGKGAAALEIAQRLRSHEDLETTNIYIHIPQEEFDYLTRQLFERNYFGYIPDQLAVVMLGESNYSREERTTDIIKLKSLFGGVYGIEASVGFLNALQAEKQMVIDRILQMGIEEASSYLFDLNANLLPGKQNNYSCFVSREGCQYPGKPCENCHLSIPNFYAISSLVASIIRVLRDLKDEMRGANLMAERTRISNLLWVKLDILESAIEKYGKEEVFQFFENGQEGYFALLDNLDELESPLVSVD